MALFGNTSSYTSSQTTVSTNTATDSYNQSAVRTENLSDVGNVSLNVGSQSGSIAGLMPILILALGGFVVFYLLKRKAA